MDAEKLRAIREAVEEARARFDGMQEDAESVDGGPGSGNWGHAGRPGHMGGSAPGGGLMNRITLENGTFTSRARIQEAERRARREQQRNGQNNHGGNNGENNGENGGGDNNGGNNGENGGGDNNGENGGDNNNGGGDNELSPRERRKLLRRARYQVAQMENALNAWQKEKCLTEAIERSHGLKRLWLRFRRFMHRISTNQEMLKQIRELSGDEYANLPPSIKYEKARQLIDNIKEATERNGGDVPPSEILKQLIRQRREVLTGEREGPDDDEPTPPAGGGPNPPAGGGDTGPTPPGGGGDTGPNPPDTGGGGGGDTGPTPPADNGGGGNNGPTPPADNGGGGNNGPNPPADNGGGGGNNNNNGPTPPAPPADNGGGGGNNGPTPPTPPADNGGGGNNGPTPPTPPADNGGGGGGNNNGPTPPADTGGGGGNNGPSPPTPPADNGGGGGGDNDQNNGGAGHDSADYVEDADGPDEMTELALDLQRVLKGLGNPLKYLQVWSGPGGRTDRVDIIIRTADPWSDYLVQFSRAGDGACLTTGFEPGKTYIPTEDPDAETLTEWQVP